MNETIVDMFNKEFEKMELFYAPIEEQILETLKRLGFGIITLKQSKETTIVIAKQLSWSMSEKECLDTVNSLFKAFEFELDESAYNFCKYTYCEKMSEDMFKITFSEKKLEVDIWNDNMIFYYN